MTGECPLIGPLQLAIHVVRNRRAGEQSHTGTRQARKLPCKIMYAFVLSQYSATFALQHGGFIPRE